MQNKLPELKIFKEGEVKGILNQLNNNEISFGKMVELLDDKALSYKDDEISILKGDIIRLENKCSKRGELILMYQKQIEEGEFELNKFANYCLLNSIKFTDSNQIAGVIMTYLTRNNNGNSEENEGS